MTIFDWNKHMLPMARLFSADGTELAGNICQVDTRTGWYEYYKLNANGHVYIDQGEVASAQDYAAPPIRIEWSRNRFLYRLEMRWHSFMFKFELFQMTGRWPRRHKRVSPSA